MLTEHMEMLDQSTGFLILNWQVLTWFSCRIAQQKRIWQKPRGPDATSEEFAHSVSSREFVTDIVHKTKNSPRRANDAIFSLTDEIVNDSLKWEITIFFCFCCLKNQ